MSRDWFAQYLMNNGRYKEAFNQFQDAFLTSCELFGDTHSQSLILLNSIGKICLLGMNVNNVTLRNYVVRECPYRVTNEIHLRVVTMLSTFYYVLTIEHNFRNFKKIIW